MSLHLHCNNARTKQTYSKAMAFQNILHRFCFITAHIAHLPYSITSKVCIISEDGTGGGKYLVAIFATGCNRTTTERTARKALSRMMSNVAITYEEWRGNRRLLLRGERTLTSEEFTSLVQVVHTLSAPLQLQNHETVVGWLRSKWTQCRRSKCLTRAILHKSRGESVRFPRNRDKHKNLSLRKPV